MTRKTQKSPEFIVTGLPSPEDSEIIDDFYAHKIKNVLTKAAVRNRSMLQSTVMSASITLDK